MGKDCEKIRKKLDQMKISDLKQNPKNPRIIKDDKFKKLVKSLQEFPEMMEKRPMVCVTDTVDGKLFPLGGKAPDGLRNGYGGWQIVSVGWKYATESIAGIEVQRYS